MEGCSSAPSDNPRILVPAEMKGHQSPECCFVLLHFGSPSINTPLPPRTRLHVPAQLFFARFV